MGIKLFVLYVTDILAFKNPGKKAALLQECVCKEWNMF